MSRWILSYCSSDSHFISTLPDVRVLSFQANFCNWWKLHYFATCRNLLSFLGHIAFLLLPVKTKKSFERFQRSISEEQLTDVPGTRSVSVSESWRSFRQRYKSLSQNSCEQITMYGTRHLYSVRCKHGLSWKQRQTEFVFTFVFYFSWKDKDLGFSSLAWEIKSFLPESTSRVPSLTSKARFS